MEPLNPAKTGLAFGRVRRRYIALSGGLMTQFYTDQPAFRAVLLHELAHLRNGDVDKTYLTLAIWRAFVAGALIPFALSSIREKALRIKPGDADTLDSLGFALSGKGRYDLAIRNYRLSLRAKPEGALAHYHLARALQKSSRTREAEQEFQVSRRLDPALQP